MLFSNTNNEMPMGKKFPIISDDPTDRYTRKVENEELAVGPRVFWLF
jgi:hypothetical protein